MISWEHNCWYILMIWFDSQYVIYIYLFEVPAVPRTKPVRPEHRKYNYNIEILMSEANAIQNSYKMPLFSYKNIIQFQMQFQYSNSHVSSNYPKHQKYTPFPCKIVLSKVLLWKKENIHYNRFFLAKVSGGYDLILSPNLSSGQNRSLR